MAKISEAYAYVEEVNGNRLRLSEKHSKKNPQSEEWMTTGYTDVNTAWLPQNYVGPTIVKGQRVKVSGVQRTETREVGDKKYKNLIWSLDTIEVVTAQVESGVESRQRQAQEQPAESVEVPF